MTAARVHYTVDLSARNAHLYAVEARFEVGGGPIDLKLPVWTPGSYLVREYPRHLEGMAAYDQEGRPLPVGKIDKATWRVEAAPARHITVRYRVYAHDLTVRAAHLDDSHGFWNGACLFLYTDALRHAPLRVSVRLPEGWRLSTALEPDPLDPKALCAESYDELVDSPVETGTHEVIPFTVSGRPHELAVWGYVPIPRDELVSDLTKIIDVQAALFGGLPYPRYTFLLLSSPNSYGGLEHARSSTLLTSPFSFAPRKKYEEFLELVSHEFFHLWNVKRIHPAALGPFDYQREAYTRCLWVMEGITSYYDRYLLVRAGLKTPKAYLEKLAEELGKIEQTPGRQKQSLEQASFDAWIKFYRPDENSPNSSISYYLKGGIVALLLDLEIRHQTKGARSLDDVMRLFYERYGARGVGFPDDAVQGICEEASGVPLAAFFDRHVRGTAELDAERLLGTVGLTINRSATEDPPGGWLGATIREEGDSAVIGTSLTGGPAETAGLFAGDELVALDGFRIGPTSLKEQLGVRRDGDVVTLTVFRRDQLHTVRVRLGGPPLDKLTLAAKSDATAAEKAAYQAWLGEALPADDS
jgi:predicted metalloprotease with PDZ domain